MKSERISQTDEFHEYYSASAAKKWFYYMVLLKNRSKLPSLI